MTRRKSRREIERAVEDLAGPGDRTALRVVRRGPDGEPRTLDGEPAALSPDDLVVYHPKEVDAY